MSTFLATVVGPVLTTICMLAGLVWVFCMVRAMIEILRLAPKGKRMRTYNNFGMWRFGEIRTDVGPAADPHLLTMRRGGIAFLIFFVVVVVISMIAFAISAMTGTTDA